MKNTIKTILIIAMSFQSITLISCTIPGVTNTTNQPTRIKRSTMIDDRKLSNAIRKHINMNKHIEYESLSINNIIDTSLAIASGQSQLLDKVYIFGEYKPFVRKNGQYIFYFFADPYRISSKINNDKNNIKMFKISRLGDKTRINKSDIDIISAQDFTYEKELINLNNVNNPIKYYLRFKTSLPEYPNAILELFYVYEDEQSVDDIERYMIPPENIRTIIIYPKNPELLKPYETIGKID